MNWSPPDGGSSDPAVPLGGSGNASMRVTPVPLCIVRLGGADGEVELIIRAASDC